MYFTKLTDCRLDKLQQEITEFEFGTDYVDNCDYIEIEELKDAKINKCDLSILQLNIRGLINKQSQLSRLINTSHKKTIDIIILSETWLSNSSKTKVNIPGYDYIGEQQINKKAGGVGILINKEMKYKVRTDLNIIDPVFENCSIEVKTTTKNIVIGSIYRPPHMPKCFQQIVNKLY